MIERPQNCAASCFCRSDGNRGARHDRRDSTAIGLSHRPSCQFGSSGDRGHRDRRPLWTADHRHGPYGWGTVIPVTIRRRSMTTAVSSMEIETALWCPLRVWRRCGIAVAGLDRMAIHVGKGCRSDCPPIRAIPIYLATLFHAHQGRFRSIGVVVNRFGNLFKGHCLARECQLMHDQLAYVPTLASPAKRLWCRCCSGPGGCTRGAPRAGFPSMRAMRSTASVAGRCSPPNGGRNLVTYLA